MTVGSEVILIALLLVNLALAGASRLYHCIRLTALAGLLLAVLPLALWHESNLPGGEVWVNALLNFGIKALALPWLLTLAMRHANVRRKLEPLIGYGVSIAVVFLLTAGAFAICRMLDLTSGSAAKLATPTALATMLTGLFMIVARKKAITQVIGFLTFENGVAIFGAGMMLEAGVVVELGILLDVLVLVFVMGIAVFEINREFEHIDADRLNRLGDWSGSADWQQEEGK